MPALKALFIPRSARAIGPSRTSDRTRGACAPQKQTSHRLLAKHKDQFETPRHILFPLMTSRKLVPRYHRPFATRLGVYSLRFSLKRQYAKILIALGLATLVCIVFGQTAHFDWVRYDDNDYVYRSGRVTSGLSFSNVAWAFTHFHASNWHPITTVSHMLDCQLFGVNPGSHHVISVVIQTCATIALFFALDSLTRKKMAKSICRWCLRHSSATRGIGGLDRRAQRRSQRFILRPHPAGVVLL